jgi:hypothetical protein
MYNSFTHPFTINRMMVMNMSKPNIILKNAAEPDGIGFCRLVETVDNNII